MFNDHNKVQYKQDLVKWIADMLMVSSKECGGNFAQIEIVRTWAQSGLGKSKVDAFGALGIVAFLAPARIKYVKMFSALHGTWPLQLFIIVIVVKATRAFNIPAPVFM